MYVKLMVRSLWRHQKRGRRLFVLLALCSAALAILLSFQSDFSDRYRDLFVGMTTGHLQVLPSNSPAFAVNVFGARDQDVPLMRVGPALDGWVRNQPEVEEAAPVINRYALAYNLDSEFESWLSLVAVPADRMAKLFPLARVLEGSEDFTWKAGDPEVRILKARLQTEFGQKNPVTDAWNLKEIRAMETGTMEAFKHRIRTDFPAILGDKDLRGPAHDQEFLDLWSAALKDQDLFRTIPAARLAEYDYRIDDALAAIADNSTDALVPFLNKRLFQALYPDDIHFLPEPIVPGKSVTVQVPGLKSEGALSLPKVVPARYAGMVDIMPLYNADSYVDLDAFRYFLDVPAERATGYVIRLKDPAMTEAFQKRLEGWIEEHRAAEGLDNVRVADYHFLGKLYLTTSTAFGVIIGILIGVFVLILIIFIVNLVLMSMIQRRREIGTGIAMGLSNNQTIVVMTGEVAVIVTVSWLAGVVLGVLLTSIAAAWGVPGMIFFPGGRLYMTHQIMPYLLSYLILLPSAVAAAVIPLSGLRKLLPVDFFREAR